MERFTTPNLWLAILLLAGNFVSFSLQAQHPPQVSDQINALMPTPIAKSPNVAAFDKYGDYEVNLFTGLPNISIPIHEAKSGSLSVPISLNYHASGIKYTDQASWVGLGWSLSAGGQVSRTVQGMVDETQSFFTNPIDWNTQSAPNCVDYEYLKNTIVNKVDREPDLYSYSFPGGSGKFYRQQSGLPPYLFPYRSLKIEFFTTNKIEITDESGVLYRYGQNASGTSAREVTESQAGASVTTAITAWHLMEIIAPNSDDKISLSYQTAGTASSGDVTHNISIASDCDTDSPSLLPCPPLSLMLTEQNTTSTIPTMGNDEILFDGGKVKFVKGGLRNDITTANSLQRIEIYSLKNSVYTKVKSYHFVYGYFKNSNNTQDLRLKLTELQLKDANDVLVNKHTFQYHSDNFSWDWAYNSYKRDYWGFYNGKANTNLIPVTTIQYKQSILNQPQPLTFGGAINRNTDPQYLTEGVLKEIHFPTGGYSLFEFEPHTYDNGGTAENVGGIRIKKITSYEGAGAPAKVKEYKYGEGETGKGVKNFDLRSLYFNSSQLIRNVVGTVTPNPFRQYTSTMYFSNSVLGQGFEESPVIYPVVTEYDGTTGSNNGKTVYEFDNKASTPDSLQNLMFSSKIYRNYKGWTRGNLTKKTVYSASGSPISETTYTYSMLQGQSKKISQGVAQYIHSESQTFRYYYVSCTDSNSIPFDGLTYTVLNVKQATGAYKQTGTTEILYTNGLPTLTKTTSKTYNATYLQLISQEESGSGTPEAMITKYRYPFDIVNMSTAYTGTSKAYKDLLLKNIFSTPFEQYSIVATGGGSVQKVVSGQLTYFKANPSNSAHVVPDKIFLLEIASPISPASGYVPLTLTSTASISKDSRYAERIQFAQYDAAGNIVQVLKTNDNNMSYIWDYGATLPIAQVINAPVSVVAYTSFEADGKGNWTFSGATSTDATSPSGAKSYLLSGGNITKSGLTSGNSYTVSYWSKNGAYTVSGTTATVTGEAKNGWTYYQHKVTGVTSLTISGTGRIDELRLYPATAQMTTYVYEPGIGLTLSTDPNNLATYYEYDGAGRLKVIKDNNKNILKTYTYTYKN